jgi:ribonuclease HI
MGGWAAVLSTNKDGIQIVRIMGSHLSDTTNNVMETWAVLEGLTALVKPCNVEIITDSQYVIYGMARIFKNKKMLESNTWLWEQVRDVVKESQHRITMTKIKGHDGDYLNEVADQVAVHCRTRQAYVDEVIPDFNQRRLIDFMGRL